VTSGLSLGDKVIVEGLQKVRPGLPVSPGPASALLQSSMKVSAEDGRTQRDDSATGTKPAAGARP
jgi:membrane fusion protein (multidrug efflux system)